MGNTTRGAGYRISGFGGVVRDGQLFEGAVGEQLVVREARLRPEFAPLYRGSSPAPGRRRRP